MQNKKMFDRESYCLSVIKECLLRVQFLSDTNRRTTVYNQGSVLWLQGKTENSMTIIDHYIGAVGASCVSQIVRR
jgi:hypothetical protein